MENDEHEKESIHLLLKSIENINQMIFENDEQVKQMCNPARASAKIYSISWPKYDERILNMNHKDNWIMSLFFWLFWSFLSRIKLWYVYFGIVIFSVPEARHVQMLLPSDLFK